MNRPQSAKFSQTRVIEPPYFSNWVDLIMPKIANKILPLVARISWITPNSITLLSFFLYVLGCLFIFISIPYHLFYTTILLPLAYVLDCLDGQLSRTTHRMSEIGNYLDKTLDVLKIYLITISLSYGTYLKTHEVLYIFLGFTACFFFNFRYYLKHETMYGQFVKNKNYLDESRKKRNELYEQKEKEYNQLSQTFIGKLKLLYLKHRIALFVDEGEFTVFTATAALFDKIEIAVWIFAISQIIIGLWRLIERGYQTHTLSSRLLWPMRK